MGVVKNSELACGNPKNNLRIGLLLDSFIQPRWIHKIIEDIQASGIAQVVLIVLNCAQIPQKRFRLQRYAENRSHLLYAAFRRFDEFTTSANPDAFENMDVEPLVKNCDVIRVEPIMTKYSDRFTDEDVRKIREYKLDVALRFGFRILKGEVLNIARHGVWSYHHGDHAVNRGGPAGFWEVMEGEPVTGAMLQILTEDLDNGKILYKSWSRTNDRFSVKMNCNQYYWKSSTFVMRKLRELHEKNELTLARNSVYEPYSNRLYRMPTNSEMLRLLSKQASRYVASKTRNLYLFDQWSLAYRFKSDPSDMNDALYRFRYLIPPRDRFWADPFPVKAGDKYFIFIEEYLFKTGKGHVSVIELDKNADFKPPVKVLEQEYHLSYPFTFTWRGDYYMIPESAKHNCVELYRCLSFPTQWQKEKVLLENVNATDATLFEADGLWWMFVNIGEDGYPTDWDELYIFYSDTPMGEWKPHKQNPVKTDVRGSRPAGQLFYWKNQLYRPAQDSSVRYGYGISINKVRKLTVDEFAEEEVSKILPRWSKNVIGTHTLNSANDFTVIDCLIRRRRF